MRTAGILLLLSLLAAACGSSVTASESAPEEASIPLSLYVLTDANDATSALSSQRTIDEVEAIAAKVQAIWQPAGVVFDPIVVEGVAVPATVLGAIALARDPNLFFDQAGRTFDVPEPGLINGFYVASAGGVNGFTPTGSTVFFVVDEPSVHDERVSSHEIGHILGLRHAADDAGRLMFSGTNGMTLTDEEVAVARYGAEGLTNAPR